jgi:hypothetical protein
MAEVLHQETNFGDVKSIETLLQDFGSTSSSHPVVDLISIHNGYGHVRTQVYWLVQWILYDHFKGFADAYVGGLPFVELKCHNRQSSKPLSDKSLGGLWNHLTGVFNHIRTVCGQLWRNVSQMATNITSDAVKFWVSQMHKLEEHSTDALLNADGESTDGVQDLLAPIMDSGHPEGIAAEIQHSVRTIASLFIGCGLFPISSLSPLNFLPVLPCWGISVASDMPQPMYLSIWATCPSCLCHLYCPIVELLEQDELSNLQQ